MKQLKKHELNFYIGFTAKVEKAKANSLPKDKIIICTLSGRGDKDVASIAKYRGINISED